MRIKALLVILLFTGFSVFGQDKKVLYGFNVSGDWNSYFRVKDLDPIDFKGRPNFSAGITFRYFPSARWSVDAAINYSTKNFKEKVDFSKYRAITPNDPALNFTGGATLLYNHGFLDIPVSLNYIFSDNKQRYFYTSLGLVGSKRVGYQFQSTESFEGISTNPPYKGFLTSVKLGIGMLVRTDKIGINVEPQARVYTYKVHRGGHIENPVHFGVQLSLLKL